MLPLSLLKTAIGHPMLVELKNGETYNGHLANCDAWMNIYLTQVICTSRDGDRFWKMPECYIRGSTIKYLRIPDEVIDNYKEDTSNRGSNVNRRGGDNSGRGGRGGSGQRGGGARNTSGSSNRGGFNSNQGNRRPASNNISSSGNITGSNVSLGGKPPAKQQRR